MFFCVHCSLGERDSWDDLKAKSLNPLNSEGACPDDSSSWGYVDVVVPICLLFPGLIWEVVQQRYVGGDQVVAICNGNINQ